MGEIKPLLAEKMLSYLKNNRCQWKHTRSFPSTLTVPVVEEVGDGRRGAAAPGLRGVDGGEDGRHEPLVAVHSKTLLAELGVVVGQTEQVTWGKERGTCFFFLGCFLIQFEK